jgi:hypothetical protein
MPRVIAVGGSGAARVRHHIDRVVRVIAEGRRALLGCGSATELAEVKDVFKDWRYIYEIPNKSVRLGILQFFRISGRRVTSKLYDGANF